MFDGNGDPKTADAAINFNPVGSVEPGATLHVYGGTPPVALSAITTFCPATASGSDKFPATVSTAAFAARVTSVKRRVSADTPSVTVTVNIAVLPTALSASVPLTVPADDIVKPAGRPAAVHVFAPPPEAVNV